MNKIIKTITDHVGDTISVDDLGQVVVDEDGATACVALGPKEIKRLRKALKRAFKAVQS